MVGRSRVRVVLFAAAAALLAAATGAGAQTPPADPYGVFLAGNDVLVGQESALKKIPACLPRGKVPGKDGMAGWGTDCSKTVGQAGGLTRVSAVKPVASYAEAHAAYCKSIEPGTERVVRLTGGRDREAKFKFDGQYHLIRNAPSCDNVAVDKKEDMDVPELPLVIPAADLGEYKAELTATKSEVLQALAAAKKEARATCGDGALNSLRTLGAWLTENKPLLEAELKARGAAEKFFQQLARHYSLMTDAERTKVEAGLLARGLTLRRYRTVKRGIVREKAGIEIPTSCADLDSYYTALSRVTWAGLEIESLARITGPINSKRLEYYGNYDVAELSETRPDAQAVAAIQASRRRQFDTLIDVGIVAVLASEIRADAMLEARKDRLFGIKEIWTGEKHPDPAVEKALKENLGGAWQGMEVITSAANALGFGLLDVITGLGADAVRAPLYRIVPDPWGSQFKSRAAKIEQQRTESWEKAQWRILALRFLKNKSLPDVERFAQQTLGRPLDPGAFAAWLGKVDPATIKDLIEDRTFVDATDGGLYRILGVTLIKFVERSRMELAIAREKTRLVRRDLEAALRVEQGQDPDTGDLTWGTLISPTAWADITSKGLIQAAGQAQRGTHINLKAAQMADMYRLEAALVPVDFDFTALPPAMGALHAQLLANSAPYIEFVQRVTQERRARYLHGWRRLMPDTLGETFVLLKRHYEETNRETATREAQDEQRRIAALVMLDYMNAWDLSGGLSFAKFMMERGCDGACAQTYAGVYRLLLSEFAWDRFRAKEIGFLRPVGDLGFFSYGVGVVGRAAGALSRTGAAEIAATAERQTFGRYLYESLNPFAPGRKFNPLTNAWERDWFHPVQTVFVQTLTEVVVADVAVPALGKQYEPLLTQTVMLALSQTIQNARRKNLKIAQELERAVAQEKAQNKEHFDANAYVAELQKRAVVQAQAKLETLTDRLASAQDPVVREAIDRHARFYQRVQMWWAKARKITELAGKVRESLGALRDKAYESWQAAQIALEAATLPPTVERYERQLQYRSGDLFNPEKALNIEQIRDDVRAMRGFTRPEGRPALDRLEARIDQERVNRFNKAIVEFIGAYGGQIEGVILNGTRLGNPEYKGIFSDLDFTVVTKLGADEAGIRKALDTIFAKQGILLNGDKRKASADIEAMVQDFLPGDVPPIRTWRDFERWALILSKDPHRYLSGGGAEWVGLYNFLNGSTVKVVGGQLVIDTTDARLLPQPEMHQGMAYGVVLDAARADKLRHSAWFPDTAELGGLFSVRAKAVLRAVDALIWAHDPALPKARTREAAMKKGYHKLIVEDALALHDKGLLSVEEFDTIELLHDIKSGKTVFQALSLDPQNPASRAQLEVHWNRMNNLMKRSFHDTRRAYLEWLGRIADGLEGHPRFSDLAFTLPFRNWNAARKVDQVNLQLLTSEQNPLPRLKQQDQLVVGRGRVLDRIPAEPAVVPSTPDVLGGLGREEDPAAGAEPQAPPRVQTPVAARGPPPALPSGVEPPPGWKRISPITEAFMELWHGSRDHASQLGANGFQWRGAEDRTYFGKNLKVAIDALTAAYDGQAAKDQGILRSRIPREIWNALVANGDVLEREYGGFHGGDLPKGTVEISPFTQKGVEVINRYRQQVFDVPTATPQDVIYGRGGEGSLRPLQQRIGGRLLNETGAPPPGISPEGWMDKAVSEKSKIYFDLTHLKDGPSSPELQHLKANWNKQFNDGNVIFVDNGLRVKAPF